PEFDPHADHVAAVGAADSADGVGVFHFAEVFGVGDGVGDFLLEVVVHSSGKFVAGDGGVNFAGPGVDAAPEGADVFEAVAGEIGGGVHALFALVIVDDEGGLAGPAAKHFLHDFLGEKSRAFDAGGF